MYKFQEDIRRDREMRDKRSKEEEFLRSSLRGSEKMKRLEHKPAPTGFVNNGYDAHAHDADHVTAPGGIGKCTAPAGTPPLPRPAPVPLWSDVGGVAPFATVLCRRTARWS